MEKEGGSGRNKLLEKEGESGRRKFWWILRGWNHVRLGLGLGLVLGLGLGLHYKHGMVKMTH